MPALSIFSQINYHSLIADPYGYLHSANEVWKVRFQLHGNWLHGGAFCMFPYDCSNPSAVVCTKDLVFGSGFFNNLTKSFLFYNRFLKKIVK